MEATKKQEGGKNKIKSGVKKVREGMPYFDYSLLAVLILLICFGLVMLYSTSAYRGLIDYGNSMYYFRKQALFTAGGFVVMFLVAFFGKAKYYKKYAKWVYLIAIVLMALVQTPLGVEVNGARRWLKLGVQFQPAEIAKIAVIICIPAIICEYGRRSEKMKGSFLILLVGAFQAGVVYKCTENLSTAMIVVGITYIMIVIISPYWKIWAGAALVLVALAIYGARVLGTMLETSGSFRLRRVLVWLNPEKYASDGGYQVMQGLYAVGSGGFFGKGLGNSTQKMVIPEVQNDMILSIICEELGVFGAIIVLVLFGLLIYRLIFIARNAPDTYTALIVAGIAAHISLQVILNVCVVINLIPTTGITLPFISYGGTSIIFLFAEMGMALGISRKIRLK